MNNIDHKSLDWHLLDVFLTVLQESNVSRAAERLNLTQSTVSHSLNKLRAIFGDPLFVRSGRGVEPTERARSLRDPVMRILDDMKALSDERVFEPTTQPLRFNIAANDLIRDVLFPNILKTANGMHVDLRLKFIPSGVPAAGLLNDARCDLIITPVPPEGPDIIQLKLIEGEMVCFYDASVRQPPETWDAYRNDNRVEVRFADGRSSFSALMNIDAKEMNEPIVSVSNFGGVVRFVKGSDLIATELNYMALGPLRELDQAPLPFKSEPVSVYMVWHRRDTTDPAHRWLREHVAQASKELLTRLD
jgi:DNA-binding transcriptional LysR family regulator